MNTKFKNTRILDLDSNKIPYGLEITFNTSLNLFDKILVEEIVDYWCDSTAISDGHFAYVWLKDSILKVWSDFDNGNFKGDLTHRNALTSGDEGFPIGLAKLFFSGHKPKTKKGKSVNPSTTVPLQIKCLYYPTNGKSNSKTIIIKVIVK